MQTGASLKQKIIFSVGGATSVLLIVAAFFVVSHIGDLTRNSVEKDASNLMHSESQKISSFFVQYAQVARTFLYDPQFQDWFMNDYPGRGTDVRTVPGYDKINNTFIGVSGRDENILSAFFSLDRTAEYFRENDQTGVDLTGPDAGDVTKGYFSTRRPWYQETLERDKFFVGSPSADFSTGVVSTVVEGPVYNQSRELIGVGGLDLQINKIEDWIKRIKYQGEGAAFLLDQDGGIVSFPGREAMKLSYNDSIAEVEKKLADTEGLSFLVSEAKKASSGLRTFQWKGEDYYVSYYPVELEFPEMRWLIGIMIPADLIESPIQEATGYAILGTLIILAVMGAAILFSTNIITNPINTLAAALKDIASGEGDLTRKIDIVSNDEVGELATHFNTFVQKLRASMGQIATQANTLQQASLRLSEVSTTTNKEIQDEKLEVVTVSTAVSQMATTALDISRNASETNSAAAQAREISQQGHQIAIQSMHEIDGLAKSMEEAVSVVQGLAEESNNIGSVVDVINAIAEQTNLLALNAAIEAARAGEQGRGFAVVADEVRSLASRTQESTEDIRTMVTKLQEIARNAEVVMQRGKNQSESGVEKARQVQDSLSAIGESVNQVQDQSSQIAVATEEQTVVAESINKSLHSISALVEKTADHADELAGEASQLQGTATDMNQVVGQFKI